MSGGLETFDDFDEEDRDILTKKSAAAAAAAAALVGGMKAPTMGYSSKASKLGKSKRIVDLPLSQLLDLEKTEVIREKIRKDLADSKFDYFKDGMEAQVEEAYPTPKKSAADYIGEPGRPQKGHIVKKHDYDKPYRPQLTDTALNAESNKYRKYEEHLKTNPSSTRMHPRTGDLEYPSSDLGSINYAKESYKESEQLLEDRGFKKVPKTRYAAGNRPHKYLKGFKYLKAVPIVGSLLGALSSEDVSAAIPGLDAAEPMGYDRSFEPDTVEYQDRMNKQRLGEAQSAKDARVSKLIQALKKR